MNWKKIGSKVIKAAPLLGSLLGGPAGGALGTAVSLVGSALGLKGEITPEEVDAVLKTDPEAFLKLQQIELSHVEVLTQLHLEDVQDARRREIDVTKITGTKDINLYVLAWTVIIGFFTLCAILMWKTLPGGSSQVVFILFGALAAGFGQVLTYFFGSSKSSRDKTGLLALKKE